MPIIFNNVAFNNGGMAISNNVALNVIKYGSTQVWARETSRLLYENTTSYIGAPEWGNHEIGQRWMWYEDNALKINTEGRSDIWFPTVVDIAHFTKLQVTVVDLRGTTSESAFTICCSRSADHSRWVNQIAQLGLGDVMTVVAPAQYPGIDRTFELNLTPPPPPGGGSLHCNGCALIARSKRSSCRFEGQRAA